MSEVSEFPNFSYRWEDSLQEGQHVYVIDRNGYDIYEGVIKRILTYDSKKVREIKKNNKRARAQDYTKERGQSTDIFHIVVNYPDYEVDEDIYDPTHILWCNFQNQLIFETQERIRLQSTTTTTDNNTETDNQEDRGRERDKDKDKNQNQDKGKSNTKTKTKSSKSQSHTKAKHDNTQNEKEHTDIPTTTTTTTTTTNTTQDNKSPTKIRRRIIYKNSSDLSSSSSSNDTSNDSSDGSFLIHSRLTHDGNIPLKSPHRPPEQPIIHIQSSKRNRKPSSNEIKEEKTAVPNTPQITTKMIPLIIENFTSSQIKISPSDIHVKTSRDPATNEIVFAFNINFQQE